jgi:hypothetical protein
MPVVNLLNVIGVPWPYINEDQLTEFATLVRQFSTIVPPGTGAGGAVPPTRAPAALPGTAQGQYPLRA